MDECCRNYTFMWVLEWSDVKIKNALGQGVKGEIYELQKGSRTAKCQKDCSRRRINFCDHLFIVKSFMSAHSFLNTFIRSFSQADERRVGDICSIRNFVCFYVLRVEVKNLIWSQKWACGNISAFVNGSTPSSLNYVLERFIFWWWIEIVLKVI